MQLLSNTDVAAITIWGEARSDEIEGRVAVGCVLRNRVADGRWGDSYIEVARAPKQFSCWNDGPDANHAAVMALAAAVMAGEPIRDPILRECYWIVDGLVAGKLTERVGRATHYHVATMKQPPAWAKTGELVAQVGAHLFFSKVR